MLAGLEDTKVFEQNIQDQQTKPPTEVGEGRDYPSDLGKPGAGCPLALQSGKLESGKDYLK